MALTLQPDTLKELAIVVTAVLTAAGTIATAIFKVLRLHHNTNVKPLIDEVNTNLKHNAIETSNNTKALERSEIANLEAQKENRAAFARHDQWQHDQDMKLQEHTLEIGHIKQVITLFPRPQ